jgi:SAM-dependent methyltransferase
MTAYAGRHAEIYDLFYADKDYAGEARFVQAWLASLADEPVRRVLDLACGTGRHALELERLGLHVTGVDSSGSMLGVARRRAAESGSAVSFLEQDMRALDVGRSDHDAILCLFDSLGYLVSNDAILEALRRVRAHLRPGGLFVGEIWHAPAMVRHFDPVRIRRFQLPDGEILRISETTIDVPTQTAEVTYTIHEFGSAGGHRSFQERQRNRFFQVQEMALLLETAGLEPVAWRAGYDAEASIDTGTWHVLVAARRPQETT